jgi:hypothetical protein
VLRQPIRRGWLALADLRAFRVAVGRAVCAQRDVHFRRPGLGGCVDPPSRHGATSGALLPGGIALVPTSAGTELAFATVRAETVGVFAQADDLDVRCHPDPVTDAPLVVFTTAAPVAVAFDQVHEHARVVARRCMS